MLLEEQWPTDFAPGHDGKPRYEDVAAYCQAKGVEISPASLCRWYKRRQAVRLLQDKAEIVKNTMHELTDQNASETQKAAVELITAQAFNAVLDGDLNPKQIGDLARAIKDCASVAIQADRYIRDRIAEKAKAADVAITDLAARKKLDPETLKTIREQVYGIFTEDKK